MAWKKSACGLSTDGVKTRVMDAFQHAIDKVGSITELAKKLKTTPQVVSNWRERGIPADRALDVEEATDGRVTAEQILAERRMRRDA